MGQLYDVGGNTILNNLRQTHYQDESGTQWRMSVFMVSKNVVKVYRLYQSQFVDESLKIRNINKFKTGNKYNTMKTKIILTENELHNIIKNSVVQILQEGQGWDLFKYELRNLLNDDGFSYSDFKEFVKNNGFDNEIKNFIDTGDACVPKDKDLKSWDVYNPNDPWKTAYKSDKQNKKVNRSALGKLGRMAGAYGSAGAYAARGIYNSLKNKIKQ